MSKLHEIMDNEDSKLGGFLLFFYYRRYKYWSKLIHRFNYHHVKPLLVEPGAVWCHWCGLRGTDYTKNRPTNIKEVK